MRILVLGGAGYIGSHTVYELSDGACSTSFQAEKRIERLNTISQEIHSTQ